MQQISIVQPCKEAAHCLNAGCTLPFISLYAMKGSSFPSVPLLRHNHTMILPLSACLAPKPRNEGGPSLPVCPPQHHEFGEPLLSSIVARNEGSPSFPSLHRKHNEGAPPSRSLSVVRQNYTAPPCLLVLLKNHAMKGAAPSTALHSQGRCSVQLPSAYFAQRSKAVHDGE